MEENSHAERELRLAGLFDEDSDYEGLLGNAIMELMDLFVKQGHSGFSAVRVATIFKKLAMHECLTPLKGDDDEWNDVGDNILQNNRVSSVFKEADTGKAYFIDGIVFRNQKGIGYSGSAILGPEKIYSKQYIKSFPFVPKTFYVDVIEEEMEKDNFEFFVKDKQQLVAVKEYYE